LDFWVAAWAPLLEGESDTPNRPSYLDSHHTDWWVCG
jgi:hypothetical protein